LNYYLPLYTQTSILLNYVLIKLKHSWIKIFKKYSNV
jgi:hypothetical protein